MGHALMENRNCLVVDSRLTQATGTAEWEAAMEMVENIPGTKQGTLAADKNYDMPRFIRTLRQMNVTAHVAQRARGSAIDKRTTRHYWLPNQLEGAQTGRRNLRLEEDLWPVTQNPLSGDGAC